MAYLVNRRLKLLGTGLEREPGQFVTDADFRTCPGLLQALLAEGAIAAQGATAVTPVSVVMIPPTVVVEQYEIPETPAEQRRKKKEAS